MQLCNYIILGQIYQISNTFWQYYYYEVIIIFSVSMALIKIIMIVVTAFLDIFI